ncbi:MAG: hypothetical protein ABEH64_08030, partial [Salinirussus sp.]
PLGSADLTHTTGGASSLNAGATNFATDAVKGSVTTLSADDDVLKITIKFDDDSDAIDVLEPGETADLEITTAEGGVTTVRVTVPDSLSGENAVQV